MEIRNVATKTLVQSAVVAGVALFVGLLLYATEIILLIFAGILVAILFCNLSDWLQRITGLGRKLCIAASIIMPFLALGIFIWAVAPSVSVQMGELIERVPKAVEDLERQARQYQWFERLMEQQERLRQALPSGSKAFNLLGKFFYTTFGALGNLVFALAVGIFIAVTPRVYINGLLHLVPLHRRERTEEVLKATGDTLGSWLLAKLIEMLIIGVMTTVGLWLIGIDLALVLGIIAALLSFIPNFGPIMSIIPAILIAMVGGTDQVLYVIALYAGVQTIESYLLTPLLQKHMVDLQPALTLTVQILFGVLAGIQGLILSVPLTAAAMVMIQMWYVEDMLGDHSLNKSRKES